MITPVVSRNLKTRQGLLLAILVYKMGGLEGGKVISKAVNRWNLANRMHQH